MGTSKEFVKEYCHGVCKRKLKPTEPAFSITRKEGNMIIHTSVCKDCWNVHWEAKE